MSPSTPSILALDLDGTLLRRDGTADPVDLAAIAAVQERGVRVSIVTGRLYSGVREVAALLGLKGLVACADGAELVDPTTHRVTRHRRIAGDASRALWGLLEERALTLFLMTEDRVLYDVSGAPLAPYLRSWTPALEQVDSILTLPHGRGRPGISALIGVGTRAVVQDTVRALKADGRFEAEPFQAHHAPGSPPNQGLWGLMVHAAGVDKGRALVDLAALSGHTPADVVAVGDWVNDIPMLRAAGRSFAMGGAEPDVTAAATDQLVALAWKGGGVAEAIARVWTV